MYQASLSAKYGEGALSDEQLLHADFGNHTLVVPRARAGYQQLEMFVYLSDVRPRREPRGWCPLRLTRSIPVERTYLSVEDYADLYVGGGAGVGSGRIDPGLPARRVSTAACAWTAPGSARFMLHVSYKPAGHRLAWFARRCRSAGEDLAWYRFVGGATVRQLTVLGFPAPGHPYWTAETLAGSRPATRCST